MSHLDTHEIINQLANLTAALTKESDHVKLLDEIITGCMNLTNADGGTLYTLNEEDENELKFTILHNQTLGIHSKPQDMPPVEIYNAEKNASKLVVVQSFVDCKTINIADAYSCSDYDFSGTRKFDQQLSYHSKSFLCVPLNDHEGETIGVLQLINALDSNGDITEFSEAGQRLVESLASLAATVLTKRKLIDAQKVLFESFIKLIGRAIDHKSPVTGKHCEQVPEIAMMIAAAVNQDQNGHFSTVSFTADEMYELRIAAWLHDCGKITTPEYIIDKATKLHTMYDRIDAIAGRFREYKQHLRIEHLLKLNEYDEQQLKQSEKHLSAQYQQLDEDLEFIRTSNTGSEFMSDEHHAKILSIGEISWIDDSGEMRTLLTKDEQDNLCIRKGTLTDDERQVMRDHIKVSIDMLESVKYPKQLQRVPEIAGNHHEHLDGSGYPRGVTAEDLTLRARIMCIADIFEALTSPDRPYKKGMLLSQSMTILGRMVEDNHLDPDLFKLFVESGTYLEYAKQNMSERQVDEFDTSTLPGLT